MKFLFAVAILFCATLSFSRSSIYQFKFETITGDSVAFESFIGKKILIFNAASKCGYTPQYEEFQKLHEKYQENLVVIGFPANDFDEQEPGSNAEIAAFCQKNYGVTFLMASKLSVIGETIHPIFKFLTTEDNRSFTGPIKWNFEKFILDEKGFLLYRFRTHIKPSDKEIKKIIK